MRCSTCSSTCELIYEVVYGRQTEIAKWMFCMWYGYVRLSNDNNEIQKFTYLRLCRHCEVCKCSTPVPPWHNVLLWPEPMLMYFSFSPFFNIPNCGIATNSSFVMAESFVLTVDGMVVFVFPIFTFLVLNFNLMGIFFYLKFTLFVEHSFNSFESTDWFGAIVYFCTIILDLP